MLSVLADEKLESIRYTRERPIKSTQSMQISATARLLVVSLTGAQEHRPGRKRRDLKDGRTGSQAGFMVEERNSHADKG